MASTAVIVPVLGRPQNAKPFMESIRATTGDVEVYAVVEEHSFRDDDPVLLDAVAWIEAEAHVIDAPGGTFPIKVNAAYRDRLGYPDPYEHDWLFITGDDVRFHPGWLVEAQKAAGDVFHVIGTNDLGNARVMSGEHGTHLLIRCSYVDEVGASWDGPGVVCHEGYRHWYTDDEIVTAAKQRGVWTSARKSIVEHLHPYWSKGVMDDTYRLGETHAAADKALFRKRAMQHLRGRLS